MTRLDLEQATGAPARFLLATPKTCASCQRTVFAVDPAGECAACQRHHRPPTLEEQDTTMTRNPAAVTLLPLDIETCPTRHFHTVNRSCGNCGWRPSMHPDWKRPAWMSDTEYERELQLLRGVSARTHVEGYLEEGENL